MQATCSAYQKKQRRSSKRSDLNAEVKLRPGTVLLLLLKQELGHYKEAYESVRTLTAATCAHSSGQRTCQYANGNPQKRHTHGIGLLHVPTVVLYCVLMSGRRGKFTTEKKNDEN